MKCFMTGLLVFTSAVVYADEEKVVQKIECTEIREEPGAPTYGFQLVRENQRTYRARYLQYEKDKTEPHEAVGIAGLQCRFLSRSGFYFQCTKEGASAESADISDRTLSHNEDVIRTRRYKEFRATGIEVPEIYMVYRFGSAATCKVTR